MNGDSTKKNEKFVPLKAEQFITNYSDKRSQKKKLFQKLVFAQSDMSSACRACELFLDKVGMPEKSNPDKTVGIGNPLFLPMLEAIIISYSRPFTNNDGVGVLQKKWSQFENPQFADAHEQILQYRNELVAHTDKNVRTIQIVPPNVCVVPTPKGKEMEGLGFRVRTVWIAARRIHLFHELSVHQATRMMDEVIKLFDELYKGMETELPNKEFDLRIDEGL